MKKRKILKRIILILIGVVFLFVGVGSFYYYLKFNSKRKANYSLLGEVPPIIKRDGNTYRDLNKNSILDIYEDPEIAIEERVEDLLSQMTLEEKAGTMFITMIGIHPDGRPLDMPLFSFNIMNTIFSFMLPTNSDMIINKKMNSFNIFQSYSADVMAKYNNSVQRIAERTRLGIPITIASDPRHGSLHNNIGANIATPAFSRWPSPLGLASTRDIDLVRDFADIARQEYLSVGIRLALHPMADLATEPRWARLKGTFGEDAALSSQMSKAYILGFQGDSLSNKSVACMSKHFSGGGPQKDGEDAHFSYGKEQVYPGNNFDYHLIPFTKGVLPAKTAQIMPYYGIPMGQTDEDVAFGFNKTIITKLLRDSLKFDGVICTDWNIITESKFGKPRSWGVEHLTPLDRVEKVLNAGCDQLGGENSPEYIITLVKKGRITEERVDESVRRILRDKFRLGLFDNPYVDVENANSIARKKEFVKKGKIAQAKSTILLKNENILPLERGIKIYLEGVYNKKAYGSFAKIVNHPKKADIILKRINTPYEKRKGDFLEQFFHQGRLFFTPKEEKKIIKLIEKKPSIVVINLERSAILTTINQKTDVLVAEFGIEDDVLAELLFGLRKPEGRLPIELPSSWEAVLEQKEDVPYDSKDPLYPYGFGLSY